MLKYIKEQLAKENCELLFVWPSAKSVNWYCRNGFYSENEIMECDLVGTIIYEDEWKIAVQVENGRMI